MIGTNIHYKTIQFNIEIINTKHTQFSIFRRAKVTENGDKFFFSSNFCPPPPNPKNGSTPLLKDILYRQIVIYHQCIEKNRLFSTQIRKEKIARYKSVAIMIEKWVNFKRDYLEISFLRENCGYDGSDDRRRYHEHI